MRENRSSHGISGVFVFLLLGIFAVFSTVMVVLGARAYKGSSERLAEHNMQRVAAAYVHGIARANDASGVLSVTDVDGLTALKMESEVDFDSYVTLVYVYDGMLREWYAEKDMPFHPARGEAVCAADEMRALISGNLLTVSLRNGGEWITVDTVLRTVGN